jgi:hypothetical protein
MEESIYAYGLDGSLGLANFSGSIAWFIFSDKGENGKNCYYGDYKLPHGRLPPKNQNTLAIPRGDRQAEGGIFRRISVADA